MKLKNLIFILIILFFGIGLGACSSDDHPNDVLVKAEISRLLKTGTDGNTFAGEFDIDLAHDLYDLNDRQLIGNIVGMNYVGGDALLRVFMDGLPLQMLRLNLIRGGKVISTVSIYNVPLGETYYGYEFGDINVDDFLYQTHEAIRKDGYATIEYAGVTRPPYFSTDVDIEILIYTDVLLRY